MRVTLQRLARLTAGYSLVTLIGPLFTILLTPLYTRVLTPADYGVVDVALTLGALVNIVIVLGTDQAMSAHFFDGDDTNKRDLVTSTLIYVALAGAVGCGVLFIFAEPIAITLFKDPTRQITLRLLAPYVLFAPLYAVLAAALRLRMGIRRVNILGFTYLITYVCLNVLFVLVLQFKATGVIAANVLAHVAGALAGLALVWKPLRGQFAATALKPVLTSGLALLPGMVGFILLANVDRILLTQYVSQSEIGLYSIANKLASMLYVAFSAVWSAWWPMAMEMAKQPDAPRQYARMFEYFIAASTVAALTMGLFAPEILRLFTSEAYWPAAPYATVLMIYTGPLAFMNGSFQISHYVGKRVGWISAAALVSAGCNIALNLVLNPIYGVWGAVIATVIAGAVFGLITYITGRGVLFVDYRWLRTGIVIGVYLIVLGCVSLFASAAILVKIAAIALLMFTVISVGFVKTSQIRIGINALRRRLL